MQGAMAYTPQDTLYLWWLERPARPVLVGELRLVRALRGVSLRYAPGWQAAGFPLSEDLPLTDAELLPASPDTAAGAVDDARPDRWGERVIRLLDQPPRLSLLEHLYFAGDERFGALGVSTSDRQYLPRRFGPLPQWSDVSAIARLVRQVLEGERVPENERPLIAPGVTLGGARPKALLDLEGSTWVLKFPEPGDPFDTPRVEHATLTLAAKAGIVTAETRCLPLKRGHVLAVRRFDRSLDADGQRRHHALSAQVALRAASVEPGYPELALLLRRRGVAAGLKGRAQMAELFRRMVFNILMDNTDDHEKNHVLLMTDRGELELSPAFDVVPSGHALGFQQMTVGSDGTDATLSNALSQCAQFGLARPDAEAQVRRVAAVVSRWKAHFAQAGVRPADIESLAQQIDRPFLADPRRSFSASPRT